MRNIADWKTTALGITLLAAGFSYIFLKEDIDYVVMSILLGAGTMFVFSPDSILTSLRRKARNISKDAN